MLSLSRSRAISELHYIRRKNLGFTEYRNDEEAIVNLISNPPRDQGCGDIYRQVESPLSLQFLAVILDSS
ncbi:hypothetical protein HZS_6717 [Henneguya salminicola]|nr:hypothetical protein HZS_6717 [Henneguya salminicola]